MRAPASTPRVGSSARSTRGAPSSARAKRTFCWLPPDSAATLVSGDGVLTPIRSICALDERALAGAAHEAALGDLAERQQRHVLAHREREHHALAMAVAGKVDDARAAHPARAAGAQRAAQQRQLPARRDHPGERAQERALPVALDAGEPHDLARLDVERDVVEAAAAERLRPRAAPWPARRRRASRGRPGRPRGRRSAAGSRPRRCRAASKVPRVSPSRSTVIRSAICLISGRRWEM